jgi:predicted HicB family RNase H-like nuclease|tara:strand:+ start:2386 stop:2718 length:333 start_codon:yes stop_codon:yes gene_type:complete
MMKYKDYRAHASYEDGVFFGTVIGTRDVITFEGTSTDELEQAFRDSVDDYLEFCKERGEEPDKEFSGQMVFRPGPKLHRVIVTACTANNVSMNNWLMAAAQEKAEKELET